MTEEQFGWILIVLMAIAGTWLSILTYLLLSRKRRSTEQLVTEIKNALQDERSKAQIVPLLNEMMETETNRNRKREIKKIKTKAKKIDVSDISELMDELDSIIETCFEEPADAESSVPPNPPGKTSAE